MTTQRELRILLHLTKESTRNRFHALLANPPKLPQGFAPSVVFCETAEQAESELERYATGEARAAILIFDKPHHALSIHGDARKRFHWAQDLCGQDRANRATLAVMENPCRLPDVDRSVDAHGDPETLSAALELVAERLAYTAAPAKRVLAPQAEVRLIRRQHELLDYFKLRHRIYRIMGYLDEHVENAPSGMEINWCDKIALHIGAWVCDGDQQEVLAGTARVVVAIPSEDGLRPASIARYDQWVTALASQDPVLQQSLAYGALMQQLPIFASQRLHTLFAKAVKDNEVCAELSRVIVAEEFRGTGLSTKLTEFALAEAAKAGVTRVLLECLAVHQGLYEKLGFTRIESASGTVLSVNQTMIGMQQVLSASLYHRHALTGTGD